MEADGVNGGIQCAVCTILLGLAQQLADLHNDSLVNASMKLCQFVPEMYRSPCQEAVNVLIPIISTDEVADMITPDVLCYGVGICRVDPGEKYCHLFPKPKHDFHESVQTVKFLFEKLTGVSSIDICNLPIIKPICSGLHFWFKNMQPIIDLDGDGFSPIQIGRGSFWRGRDCFDENSNAYPGHNPSDYDAVLDNNCNGIFGMNKETGEPYEKELCQSSRHRGIVLVGDSVCARYRVPEAWMDVVMMNEKVFFNATDPLFNEFDWPQLGWGVGYMNSSDPLMVEGLTDSLYMHMRERNRCIHRDYQNLCHNGDLSIDTVYAASLISRNASTDHPILLIYNVIGNDVCNKEKDTISNMTTPEKFYENVMTFLNQLPPRLPAGSHVVLVALVDGSFIYDAMNDRYHPIGRFRKDVKYKDVYKWYTCMNISPCNGWLTSNVTLRQAATSRSVELSAVLRNISLNHNFSFSIHYVENPINAVINDMMEKNASSEIWKLIEPVDSFHPNQLAQPLIAKTMWENIMRVAPEALGDVNPNNDVIQALFGEQGGH